MPADPAIIAAYRRAFDRAGVTVKVTRINGVAPNAVTFSAVVPGIVRNDNPDRISVEQSGYAASKVGAMTEGDRFIIVMAADLAAKNFPLPVRKNDKVTLLDDAGNEFDTLNVVSVDPMKRAVGAAIEIKAAGVK